MTRIPVYTQQTNTPNPELAAPTQAAFGSDVAQSLQNFGDTATKVGNILQAHAEKVQKHENEAALVSKDTDARKTIQDTLYNPDIDPKTNMPIGLLNRNLGQTKGITSEFDRISSGLLQEQLSSIPEEYRDSYSKQFTTTVESYRDNVIKHEASQLNENRKQAFEANLYLRTQNSATISTPSLLGKSIEDSIKINTSGMSGFGASPETIQEENNKLRGEQTKLAVETRLAANDVKGAKSIFDSQREKLSPEYSNSITKALEGKLIEQTAQNVWDQVKGFILSDGTPDVARMQSFIEKQKNIPTDQRDEVVNYVQAKAGDLRSQISQRQEANWNGFRSAVTTAKNSGHSIDYALKLTGKYASNPYQASMMKKFAQDTFAPPDTKTDPSIFISLWKQANNRQLDQVAIDNAYKSGAITPGDYRNLSETLSNSITKGIDTQSDDIMNRITLNAKAKIKDKHDQAVYLYQAQNAIKGKTPSEAYKIADDLLKDVVVTPHTFWFDSKAPAYKAINDLQSANLLKDGTKISNAKESLKKLGQSITPSNVQYVLQQYPDGIVPSDVEIRRGK